MNLPIDRSLLSGVCLLLYCNHGAKVKPNLMKQATWYIKCYEKNNGNNDKIKMGVCHGMDC